MPGVSISELGHATAGACSHVAVTHLSNDRIVSALRTASGDLKVTVWDIAADGTVVRQGDASAGAVDRVAITDWSGQSGVITAVRTGSGALEVIAWQIASSGSITRKGSATGGAISDVKVSSPAGFGGVMTAAIDHDGNLQTISWALNAQGDFTKKSTAAAGAASAIAVQSLAKSASHARVAVGVRNGSQDLEIITWEIASSGTLTRVGRANAGPITEVALTARATQNADVFSLTTGASGDLTVIGWTIDDAGALTRFTSATGGLASSVSVTNFHPDIHTYAVGAMRSHSGVLELIAWRNGLDLTRHGVMTTSLAIASVASIGWSGGIITLTTDAAGALRVTSWKVKPSGVRLLRQEWPVPSAPPPAAPAPNPTPSAKPHLPSDLRAATAHGVSRNRPTGPPPPGPPMPDGSGGTSPAPTGTFYPPVSAAYDPMIAVGHDFVVVTQDHRIVFLDRNGALLTSTPSVPMNMDPKTFFQGFLDVTNPDGTPNANNVNLISPTTISEFYDTRVTYDPVSRRFVILSAARQPGTAVIRYFAFAVSKTQDPRDGFFQYMTTESNYRDFPRLVVHNGMILQGHNAAGPAAEGETPVLYAFDLTSAGQGASAVPNWEFYASDLNGAVRIFPVLHHGTTAGLTTVVDIRGGDSTLHIAAFPAPTDMWLAPAPMFADAPLASGAPTPGPFMVFRGTTLQFAGPVGVADPVPNVTPIQVVVRAIRVPFSQFTSAGIAVDTAHIGDVTIAGVATTDAPTDVITYDRPHLAVNVNGDALIVYGRTGFQTAAPLYPEVRYSVWRHNETTPRSSALLQAGGYLPTQVLAGDTTPVAQTHEYKLDYVTAVVDPADDTTVWMISEDPDLPTNYWKTVAGKANPSS